MYTAEAASLLGNTPLFAALDDAALTSLGARAIERAYAKGQFIFNQGDRGDSLFVLVEGLVKVAVSSEDGEEMVLVTLQPPDTFGELAVVDGGPRSASAQAVEAARSLVITRGMLLDLLDQQARVTEALLRSLGSLLRRLTEQAGDLVFLDLHGRVAKLRTDPPPSHRAG
jgi:CRP/FNR family cyclic AMP-dependent transcriptional regulator